MTRVRLLVVLVLAALSTGAASWSATRTSSPPHVERPTAGATAPLPLTVVGGEQPEAVIT